MGGTRRIDKVKPDQKEASINKSKRLNKGQNRKKYFEYCNLVVNCPNSALFSTHKINSWSF